MAEGRAIDPETVCCGRTTGVEQARVGAPAASVLGVGMPHGHEAAVGKGRQLREGLIVGGEGGSATRRIVIDQNPATLRDAVGVVALEDRSVAVAVRIGVIGVGDREAAVGEADHGGLQLLVSRHRIDAPLAAHRVARGVETLGENAAAPVVAGLPGHHKTAVGQRRRPHAGVGALVAGSRRGHLELGSNGRAVQVVALGIDAVLIRILTVGLPDDHVLAGIRACQMDRGRIGLGVVGVGVDLRVARQQRHRTVGLRGDVEVDRLGHTLAAVAVTDGNLHHPPDRCRRTGGVGQPLRHTLDDGRGGVAVEHNHQLRPALPVAGNGADRNAAEADRRADRGAADTDLPGAIAFVQDREIILSEGFHVVGGISAQACQHRNAQRATREIGGIPVDDAQTRIDQLRRGIDGVFIQGDRAFQIQQLRVFLTRHRTRRAKQALEHAVAALPRHILGVRCPGGHEIAVGQTGHNRVVLGISARLAKPHGPVDLGPGGVELLAPHVDVIVEKAAVTIPGDDEAAVGECRSVRPQLLIRRQIRRAHHERAAHRHAARRVALAEHRIVGFVGPHHHEIAIRQRDDRRVVLVATGVGIDLELGTHLVAAGIEALAEYSPARTVLIERPPDGNKARLIGT